MPIEDSVFDQPDDHFLFESLSHHLLKLFEGKYLTIEDIDKRADIPISAKNAWYLWQFAMDVSSSGIPDYLLNHCSSVDQVSHTRSALQTVKAVELLVLLDAAIPFALEISKPYGEFSAFPVDECFNQFPVNPEWTDLAKIAERSWTLAAAPFMTLVGAYLRAHREELQQKA
jgi:hypothetical protein